MSNNDVYVYDSGMSDIQTIAGADTWASGFGEVGGGVIGGYYGGPEGAAVGSALGKEYGDEAWTGTVWLSDTINATLNRMIGADVFPLINLGGFGGENLGGQGHSHEPPPRQASPYDPPPYQGGSVIIDGLSSVNQPHGGIPSNYTPYSSGRSSTNGALNVGGYNPGGYYGDGPVTNVYRPSGAIPTPSADGTCPLPDCYQKCELASVQQEEKCKQLTEAWVKNMAAQGCPGVKCIMPNQKKTCHKR